MFDGMAEQFYQFLAARTTTPPTNNIPTTSLPLSFTLHNHTNNAHHHHHHHHHFPTYSSSPSQQQQHTFDASYHHLLHQHHHPHFLTKHNNVIKDDDDDDESTGGLDPSHHHSAAADLQTQQHVHTTTNLHDATQTSLTMLLPEIPWSNDEMLALFRIRSSVDNTWFPDYIWETVSRKLAELGFKRSAEKCKEKFEEETRSFNSSIISNCNNNNNNNKNNNNASNNNNNNYRLFHELEELCNNNNANNTMNGNVDHGSLQPQHPLLAPTTLAPSERDQFSQPPLSRKDQCLDGDEEDDDNNEDGEDDLGMDDEGDNAGGERLGDDEEEEEGGDHTRNDENKNNVVGGDEAQSVGDSEKTEENAKRGVRKRKRQKKFEMFKGFCEKIVNEMMAQQQQLHYKILQDMVKRDEEKIAKEEAWKKQEIERLEKELEVRAHEQAIAGDRQAKIFDFLNKFSTSSSNVLDTHSLRDTLEKLNKVPNFTSSNNSSILSQDSIISAPLQPTSSCTTHDDTHTPPLVMNHQTSCPDIIPISSSNENLALLSPIRLESSKLAPRMSSSSASQNPNLVISRHNNDSPTPPSVVSSSKKFSRPDHTSTNATDHVTNFKTLEDQNDTTPVVRSGKDDTGRRWPRDEVLALINIRCSLFNNNNGSGGDGHNNDKEGFSKGPLWERISHKMTELGYKRSAKRCKEKWENINKYFRKTKDMNKKRSIDSRTCPYFHQLSHLYSQGTLVGPTDRPVDLPGSPETTPVAFSVTQGGSNTPANHANNSMHTSQGNEGVVQVPGFDFEF